eukprot:2531161-Rhodomonas_salina.6
MSGTDVCYAAIRRHGVCELTLGLRVHDNVLRGSRCPILLRICYAMSGTDLAYAGPRVLVSTGTVV